MPRKISKEEFNERSPKRGPKPMDWPEEWFDGQAREFTHDEDFPTMNPTSFRMAYRREAIKRGKKVKTSLIDDDTVLGYTIPL